MRKDREGNYWSKSTMKVTATETTKKVEFEVPNNEQKDVTAGLLKNNHLRGMYTNYCILNQDFLLYVISCRLTSIQSRMLFLLMANMDKENKVLINNQILIKELKSSEKSIIEATKKLEQHKIIVRQKLGVSKYEYEIRYDMLNPQMAFKNKSSKENVKAHKALMHQEAPYIKQYTTDGYVDLINSDTGEIFETRRIIK